MESNWDGKGVIGKFPNSINVVNFQHELRSPDKVIPLQLPMLKKWNRNRITTSY